MSHRAPNPPESPAVLQLVARLEPDQAGRDTVDLARALRARGWRSLVASAGGQLERELAPAGATHLPLPLDAPGRFAQWRNGARLGRAIRDHRVALVHARAPGSAHSGAAAASAANVPFVATLHDLEPPKRRPPHRGVGAMLAARRVIAVSDFAADTLVADHCVAPDRIRVVHRWFDPVEFDPGRVRGHRVLAVAERLGIVAGPKVVLAPALHPEDRGHLLLLEALATLSRSDCVALLVGVVDERGDYGRALVAAVRTAGLGERVRFAAATTDLPATLSLADVVVLPAKRPMPSGVLAAMAQAMGKPVIVTSQGALAECVMPASTGWLVPPDDAGELARALELALTMDDGTRQRLAARARAFACGEFSLDAMCARTIGIYQELVPTRGRVPGEAPSHPHQV